MDTAAGLLSQRTTLRPISPPPSPSPTGNPAHSLLTEQGNCILTRIQLADIDNLNIMHVAGTKGKGSTCAWIESFLRAHGRRTGFPKKTGLYTSPHLICPEERIRINFEPLSREKFARYLFEVWDCLIDLNNGSTTSLPRYLQLLLLVAFHAFISEGVDAAIIETHHGGEYDSTNVISRPVATVIASLGMDHVEQLGPTIENIAWHKAGIFKKGAHAFSAPQGSDPAAEALRRRAAEKEVPIQFVSVDESLLPAESPQLKPAVQVLNFSVALAAARHFLRQRFPHESAEGSDILSDSDIRQAVEGYFWPGRFQMVLDGPHQWYLDGAHNEMSVGKASEWFIGAVSEDTDRASRGEHKRVLIFGQFSSHRDAISVLDSLAVCLKPIHFDRVVFTMCQSSCDRAQPDRVRTQGMLHENSRVVRCAWLSHSKQV